MQYALVISSNDLFFYSTIFIVKNKELYIYICYNPIVYCICISFFKNNLVNVIYFFLDQTLFSLVFSDTVLFIFTNFLIYETFFMTHEIKPRKIIYNNC